MTGWDDLAHSALDRVVQTFGQPFTFAGEGLAPVSTTPAGDELLGVFDPTHVLVEPSPEGGPPIETVTPALTVALPDLGLPVGREVLEADQVVIGSTTYGIHGNEPDPCGQGVVLLLYKVGP